jgi:predicted RNA-binding Zn-ribbon protein involved in translation (DUF1610 family)
MTDYIMTAIEDGGKLYTCDHCSYATEYPNETLLMYWNYCPGCGRQIIFRYGGEDNDKI